MICQISNIIFHVLIPLQNKHGSFLKYVDSGFMCKCVIPTRVFSVGGLDVFHTCCCYCFICFMIYTFYIHCFVNVELLFE